MTFGPAGQDLAVARRSSPRRPGSAWPTVPSRDVLEVVDRDDRRGLGEAVALDRSAAPRRRRTRAISAESGAPPETKKRSRPPVRCPQLARRPAGRRSPCLSAERRRGPACPASVRSAQASPTRLAQRKICCLSGRAGHRVLQDPGVDLLVQPRHRAARWSGGPRPCRPRRCRCSGVVDDGARRATCSSAPPSARRCARAAGTRGTRRRPAQVEDLQPADHVRGDVAVGQHHALGVAGGARGVDQRGEVVRVRPAARPPASAGTWPARPCPRASRSANGITPGPVASASNAMMCRSAGARRLPDVEDLLQLRLAGDEDRHGAGVAQDVVDLARGEGGVDRDVGAAGGEAGEVGDGPLGPVLARGSRRWLPALTPSSRSPRPTAAPARWISAKLMSSQAPSRLTRIATGRVARSGPWQPKKSSLSVRGAVMVTPGWSAGSATGTVTVKRWPGSGHQRCRWAGWR